MQSIRRYQDSEKQPHRRRKTLSFSPSLSYTYHLCGLDGSVLGIRKQQWVAENQPVLMKKQFVWEMVCQVAM